MATLAGIVGYRGYSGAELARILERHPRVTPVLLEHREDAAVHLRPQGPSGPRHVPCTPEAVPADPPGTEEVGEVGVAGCELTLPRNGGSTLDNLRMAMRALRMELRVATSAGLYRAGKAPLA